MQEKHNQEKCWIFCILKRTMKDFCFQHKNHKSYFEGGLPLELFHHFVFTGNEDARGLEREGERIFSPSGLWCLRSRGDQLQKWKEYTCHERNPWAFAAVTCNSDFFFWKAEEKWVNVYAASPEWNKSSPICNLEATEEIWVPASTWSQNCLAWLATHSGHVQVILGRFGTMGSVAVKEYVEEHLHARLVPTMNSFHQLKLSSPVVDCWGHQIPPVHLPSMPWFWQGRGKQVYFFWRYSDDDIHRDLTKEVPEML